MKALRVSHLSPDLSGVELIEMPAPDRAPGEVLVRIGAASLNFPDLLMTRGEYQFKPEVPFTSGMEFAGEVVAAEPGCGFSPGDKVVGGNKTGAFAELASLHPKAISHSPRIAEAQAAAMGAAYTTAYTGLVELCGLKPGQWVLVTGASGGVGLAACDLAKALGAKVIAATGSHTKRAAILRACPAIDEVIVSEGRFREAVAEITGGALCDVVFDCVGGDVFDECTRCVAFAGKLVVVGFTSGRIAEIATNIPLIKGFSVVGLRAGEYARRLPERGAVIKAAVHELAEAGRINPAIDRVLPLSQWREGFEAMQNRELVGKLVFEPGS